MLSTNTALMLLAIGIVLYLVSVRYAGVFAALGLTGEAGVLETYLETMSVNLFVNNYTPLTSSAFGDFTAPTYTGSGAQAVNAWSTGVIAGNDIPIVSAAKTFTVSGSGGSDQAYGYYVYNGSNVLLFAERFPSGPYAMSTVGDAIQITLTELLTRT